VEAVGLRVALSRPVRAAGRRLGLPALLASASTVDGTVLVLTGDPADPVGAGRRLMRTWLALGRHGVAVHPLSQVLDCPQTAASLAAMVDGTPLALFRAGRPVKTPPRSARLPAPRRAPASPGAAPPSVDRDRENQRTPQQQGQVEGEDLYARLGAPHGVGPIRADQHRSALDEAEHRVEEHVGADRDQ
jgi:hypothetical protein